VRGHFDEFEMIVVDEGIVHWRAPDESQKFDSSWISRRATTNFAQATPEVAPIRDMNAAVQVSRHQVKLAGAHQFLLDKWRGTLLPKDGPSTIQRTKHNRHE
jgi:hypothetical protein